MISPKRVRLAALVGAAALVFAACGADDEEPDAVAPEPDAEEDDAVALADSITFVDTAGGANFQRFFNELLPGASEELGIDIDYVPSSAPEMQQRLEAQADQDADIGLILLKPDGIANMLEAGLEFIDLREFRDQMPNLEFVNPAELETAIGVQTDGQATPFWRDQFGIIYDSAQIPDPPATWDEFYERRDEWAGHIGMIRSDADSGGGRLMQRDFLISQGADFSLPLEELQETAEWDEALARFEDFSGAFATPLASEPPVLFEQFQDGEVWITEYAIDFSLWSRDQGLLPDTVRAVFLEEGHYGDAAYLAIPANLTDEDRAAAMEVVNWLLSVEAQVTMNSEMWQYMGIDRFEEVPEEVWENIPTWDEVQASRIPLTNFEAFGWLRENGMDLVR